MELSKQSVPQFIPHLKVGVFLRGSDKMKVKANESPEIQQAETSNRPLDLDRRLIPSKPKGDGSHPMFFSDEMEKVTDYGITLGRLKCKLMELNKE